jgi:hypothetical protein
MTPTQRYSLEQHAGPYASWPLTSALRVEGRDTGQRVPGFVIDAQYDTPLGVLLITSWDCPFEESSDFLLLDGTHQIIAQHKLMAPYVSYLLDAHWPIDDTTLALHYQNHLFCTLSVVPPAGVWRRRPRLRLRLVPQWRKHAQMLASWERLQARLARTACDDQGSAPPG